MFGWRKKCRVCREVLRKLAIATRGTCPFCDATLSGRYASSGPVKIEYSISTKTWRPYRASALRQTARAHLPATLSTARCQVNVTSCRAML